MFYIRRTALYINISKQIKHTIQDYGIELDIDEQFSALQIGGEAFEAFDFLYVNNDINPRVVTIVNLGEGHADNWTKFTDPDYRLFKLMQLNSEKNDVSLPEFIFTNMVRNETCFWSNYNLNAKKTFSKPNSNSDVCYAFELK